MSDGRGPLAEYLLELCESQNLTMRQASIRSGLDPSTIAKIVRRSKHGGAAEPATLQALADTLNGDFHRMMVLAGHLDEPPEVEENEDLTFSILRLQGIWRELWRLDPETAERFVDATLAASTAVRDAARKEEGVRIKE